MNKQTLYIILIIGVFNFLLINIFRLQKEITVIRNKNNKVKELIPLKPLKPLGNIKPNNYKKVSKINNNNNNGTGTSGVKEIMNDISELVPIDFNKIIDSKDKFTPKYKQV
jgi:hypothetical protein